MVALAVPGKRLSCFPAIEYVMGFRNHGVGISALGAKEHAAMNVHPTLVDYSSKGAVSGRQTFAKVSMAELPDLIEDWRMSMEATDGFGGDPVARITIDLALATETMSFPAV